MKKRTVMLGLAALAAGAAAAVLLTADRKPEEPRPETPEDRHVPADADRTIACTLKCKHTDHTGGEPVYRFELETPDGVKEYEVTRAHYETYCVGDEVLCEETENGPKIL